MSKITQSTDFDRLQTLEDLKRYLNKFGEDVVAQVNGGLTFAENLDATTVSVTFSSANTDTALAHGLNRIPTGYILVGSTAAMGLYDGVNASTASLLYLRASATGTARVLIY